MRPRTEKVVACYLSPTYLHAAFHESFVRLIVHDSAMQETHRDEGGGRIINGGGSLHIQAGANLSAPRNSLVRRFLTSEADWMWMVDSDMTFDPDTVERLLEFAEPDPTSEKYAPIVGGLCFGFDERANIQPTLFGLVGDEDAPQVIRYHEWPPDAMFQVAATGAACLLVHRSVFERIRDVQLPGARHPGFNRAFPWFQEVEHDGTPVSEDITFCWRAGLLGIPIYVNTGVRCGHIKDRELTMDAYFRQRGLMDDSSFGAIFKDAEASV